MAKLVDKKHGETVYTLELTEKELARLVAGYGASTAYAADKMLRSWGLPYTDWVEFNSTYLKLKTVLGVSC